MDFNLKDYQIVKLKKYFKNSDFFFLFHSAKLNLNQWTYTEQNLKKLKLNYSKTLNGTTLTTLKSSIYRNLSAVICGFVLFMDLNCKTTELDLKLLQSNLKPSFSLITVKLNNKIYSTSQLKGLNDLSYNKNIFNLHKSLDKYLKTSHVLTNKKIISK